MEDFDREGAQVEGVSRLDGNDQSSPGLRRLGQVRAELHHVKHGGRAGSTRLRHCGRLRDFFHQSDELNLHRFFLAVRSDGSSCAKVLSRDTPLQIQACGQGVVMFDFTSNAPMARSRTPLAKPARIPRGDAVGRLVSHTLRGPACREPSQQTFRHGWRLAPSLSSRLLVSLVSVIFLGPSQSEGWVVGDIFKDRGHIPVSFIADFLMKRAPFGLRSPMDALGPGGFCSAAASSVRWRRGCGNVGPIPLERPWKGVSRQTTADPPASFVQQEPHSYQFLPRANRQQQAWCPTGPSVPRP